MTNCLSGSNKHLSFQRLSEHPPSKRILRTLIGTRQKAVVLEQMIVVVVVTTTAIRTTKILITIIIIVVVVVVMVSILTSI